LLRFSHGKPLCWRRLHVQRIGRPIQL
jgi:hypothetical protein